jgi:predicted phage terminase large subunit-like protein
MAVAALQSDFDYEQLSPAEQEELNELLEAKANEETLYDFIRRIAPHEPPPPHLQFLIGLFQRARTERIRACVSMPPRHGKTITVLRAIAWWFTVSPTDTCGYFAYNSDFGESKSRIARDIARGAGCEFDPARNNLNEWRIRHRGGGLLAGGVHSGFTGQGAQGFVVVDDPFKDRKEADSRVRRDDVWDWFKSVVMTRLEGASVIVLHTRWHPDDLIGRLEAAGGWEIYNFPAIAPANDVLGREPGEALWASRGDEFTAEYIGTTENKPGTLRSLIGEFEFQALYQGAPRPRGSKLFGDAHYYDPTTFDVTGWRITIGADGAATKNTSSDWSAAVVLATRGKAPNMEGRILHVYHRQVLIPQFARDLRGLQMQWHGAPLHVEAVGGFKAVPDLLREANPDIRVTEAPAVGDKFSRAQPASGAWNAATLQVPIGAPWVSEFLDELQTFTGVNDKKDDQVDALAHAWNAAAMGPQAAVMRAPPQPLGASRYATRKGR